MSSWSRIGVLAVALWLAACTSEPIQSVERTPFDGSPTLGQAQTAIMRAGTSLGWDMSPVAPGHVRGTLDVRSHHAVVDITFDTESYSIVYFDSDGLDYDDDGTIHRSYNRWVRNLQREINAESLQ